MPLGGYHLCAYEKVSEARGPKADKKRDRLSPAQKGRRSLVLAPIITQLSSNFQCKSSKITIYSRIYPIMRSWDRKRATFAWPYISWP